LKQAAEGETLEEEGGSWEHLVEQSKRRIEHFSFGGGSESKVSRNPQKKQISPSVGRFLFGRKTQTDVSKYTRFFCSFFSSSPRSLVQVEIEMICSVGTRCKIGAEDLI
jgi:hypothetical protein